MTFKQLSVGVILTEFRSPKLRNYQWFPPMSNFWRDGTIALACDSFVATDILKWKGCLRQHQSGCLFHGQQLVTRLLCIIIVLAHRQQQEESRKLDPRFPSGVSWVGVRVSVRSV